MQFEGEHLLVGKTGHLFVLVAFTASLLSTISPILFQVKKLTLKRNHPGSGLQGSVSLPRLLLYW